MTRDEFQELMGKHYDQIVAINSAKGHDYAGDEDALANFKLAAARLGMKPMQIWGVYISKHWSAIETYVKEGAVKSEPIEGRFHDLILYAFLGLALIEEND
jgi:hypothetical protein